jgi:hypothetical protein
MLLMLRRYEKVMWYDGHEVWALHVTLEDVYVSHENSLLSLAR